MSFPRYERYKKSGVAWLGEVPEQWDTMRLRILVEIKKRIVGELGHDVLSITQQGIRVKDTESNEGQQALDYSKYQRVEPGDFAMNHMDLLTGFIDVASMYGVTSPDYRVFSVRPGIVCSSRYLLYVFQNAYRHQIFYAFGQGASQLGRWRLPTDQFNDFVVPFPPEDEQEKIAKFLDKETVKIDALIGEQQRLIALLREKRKAVISHAVTKGTNCSVASRWLIIPLRYFARLHRGFDLTAEEQSEGPYVVVTSGGITGTHAQFMRKAPGVVTGRYGSTGRLFYIDTDYWPHNTTLFVSDFFGNNERFVWYALQALDLSAHSAKAAVPGIDRNDIHPLPIVKPPLDEQVRISAYLDTAMNQLEALENETLNAIALLEERRSALISAAVTGKINVTTQVAKPVRSTWNTGFARQVLAAEVLSRCNGPNMGRIKLQKLIHLCEYHAQLDELGSTYSRKAAGPFDAQAMAGVREGLSRQHWFQEYRDGERYAYRPLEKTGGHKQYLPHWEDKQSRIDLVLNLLKDARTRTCEIASTLYAAWNDLLIEGKNPTDAEIIHEASSAERWHESKEKIAADKWPKALEWMRAKGLVPVGYGAHTMHQTHLFKGKRHEPA